VATERADRWIAAFTRITERAKGLDLLRAEPARPALRIELLTARRAGVASRGREGHRAVDLGDRGRLRELAGPGVHGDEHSLRFLEVFAGADGVVLRLRRVLRGRPEPHVWIHGLLCRRRGGRTGRVLPSDQV